MGDFLASLAKFDCSVSYASIDKAALRNKYATPAAPHLLALQFVCEKVESFLSRQTDPLRQRALLIADETHEHERFAVEQLKRQKQGEGGEVPGRQISRLVDNIHFVRSQDSRLVQLADAMYSTAMPGYRRSTRRGLPTSDFIMRSAKFAVNIGSGGPKSDLRPPEAGVGQIGVPR